jgi:hypothetical protein
MHKRKVNKIPPPISPSQKWLKKETHKKMGSKTHSTGPYATSLEKKNLS